MISEYSDFPLEVPETPFDQRNEMFKRRTWDESFIAMGKRLYEGVEYKDVYGFRKLDYALRNAAMNIEYEFASGMVHGNTGLYSWDNVAPKVKRFIEVGGKVSFSPERNSQIVRKAARFLGADLVGFCAVHPNLIYSHEYDPVNLTYKPIKIPEGFTHAIVMAVEMDYDSVRYSPDGISGASTGLGYSKIATVANHVATFLRGLGFRAIPSGNDTAISIPFAIAAGLGELGRNGLLITEKYGPRVRICKVFTDFPLIHDKEKTFGVERFCQTCKKCAKKCPSRAISDGQKTRSGPSFSNHPGPMKWYINPEKCFKFWVDNMLDCNNCVMSCPFNKPAGGIHTAARMLIKHAGFLNPLLVVFDDLLGYGKSLKSSYKNFWETG
jgi:reductive dehalogenase